MPNTPDRRRRMRAAIAAAIALAAPRLGAQPLANTSLDFSALASLWGPGAPTTYTATANWGKAFSVGKSVDGGSGFTWDLSGSAHASFNFANSAQVSGGSLSASYHGTVETRLDAPREIRAGDRVTVRNRFDDG